MDNITSTVSGSEGVPFLMGVFFLENTELLVYILRQEENYNRHMYELETM